MIHPAETRAAVLTLATSRGVRMTVAGDSLALGIGASDSSRGFAFDLFRRIVALRPGSEVTNLAIGGTTVGDVLRLEVPRLAATSPQLVLVEAGANDALHHTTPAAFARDYAALVSGVRRAAPTARLVLFSVPDVSVSPLFEAAAKPQLHAFAVAYNASVYAQARRVGARVVDLYAFSQAVRGDAGRYLSADAFHPSDDGHATIAADAWPTVSRSLPP